MGFETNAAGKQEIMVPALGGRPLVGRSWFGRTPKHLADEYLGYKYENGVLEIEKKPGNLGVQQFRQIRGDVAAFTVISYWSSMEAMRAMDADGGDVRRVAHLEKDPDYLLELPEFVEVELPEFVEVTELHANDWSLNSYGVEE